ncbi:hypothetical protein MPL1_08619 [Methylophaga lonarensis MPL]|uniref:Retropepsin-like aspartic endopeptidase domain-containing protein n=1 Tax=Methylophaga lonarensis MPL TaxID=1286106 RepID=M7PG06_9GAMM|nr:ATP-dependent zinc protease [Methylophaga lonarensis]EMR12795.1 hypothetical protein MPL1_08619 [Methylophaga lonarensis MPL]
MDKKTLPLVLLFSGLLSACVQQTETRPVLTIEEVESTVADSEQRLTASIAEQCAAIEQTAERQATGVLALQLDQQQILEQIQLINERLDTPPEPIIMMAPQEPQQCPPPPPPKLGDKVVLGEVEWIWVETLNRVFKARVDTGATTSSMHARDIVVTERDGKNWVRFSILPEEESDASYDIEAPLVRYAKIRQSSADGTDRRPVVSLTIRIGELTERAEFTLTDRSHLTYPILLGREFIRDIAVVDVAKKLAQPKPQPLENVEQAPAKSAPEVD